MEDDGLGPFLDVTDYLFGEDVRRERRRPSVATTSYEFNEPDLDPSAMKKLCNSYLQLRSRDSYELLLRDGGVSGSGFAPCPDNDLSSTPSHSPVPTSPLWEERQPQPPQRRAVSSQMRQLPSSPVEVSRTSSIVFGSKRTR